MQNQYVGDIGDFGKYGMLRTLIGHFPAATPRLRLGINWYLFPDESHKPDGRKIHYLAETGSKRRRLSDCDEELFASLGRIVAGHRSVHGVETARIFPTDTAFFAECIATDRAGWHQRALAATAKCNVVFLDPDNGIARTNRAKARSGKHVFLDEIADYLARGQILVIYHHLCRIGSGEEQIQAQQQRLVTLSGGAEIRTCWYHRGTARAYFIVTPANSKSRTHLFPIELWQRHFSLHT